jgi:hypothetical protein
MLRDRSARPQWRGWTQDVIEDRFVAAVPAQRSSCIDTDENFDYDEQTAVPAV